MSEPADPDARLLAVEVTAVRYRVPDGDFAVLSGLTGDGDEVTVTGPLAHLHAGESAEVGGQWRRHATHGWQFHAARVRVLEPVSSQALIAYLSSIKHVGKRGAAWLVEQHGAGVLAAIDGDPRGALGKVPGIGRQKVGAAVRSWEDQGEQRAMRLFLEEHGVPAAAPTFWRPMPGTLPSAPRGSPSMAARTPAPCCSTSQAPRLPTCLIEDR